MESLVRVQLLPDALHVTQVAAKQSLRWLNLARLAQGEAAST